MRTYTLFALSATILCSSTGTAQDSPISMEIIRGRVLGSDSLPIHGVEVTIKPTAGSSSRTVRTDREGVYTAVFSGTRGEYIITLSLGRGEKQVITARRRGNDNLIVADVVLASRPAIQLKAVDVRPVRKRPGHGVFRERAVSEMSNEAPGAMPIQLEAWERSDPSNYSILGIDPSQNSLSVNGETVQAILPNASRLGGRPRMISATADPSRGGFSGGLLDVGLGSEANYHLAMLDVTLAPAAWQSREPGVAAPSTLTMSLSSWNPLFHGRVHHTSILSLTRVTSPLSQIPSHPNALYNLGLSPDSLDRLYATLGTLGVPITHHDAPHSRVTQRIAALSVLRGELSPETIVTFTANFGRETRNGDAITTTSMPSHGGTSHATSAFLTANASKYWGAGILSNISANVNVFQRSGQPYLQLPEGRVRIQSAMAEGDTVPVWIQFGGNPMLSSDSRTISGAMRLALSRFSIDSKHRYTIEGGIRFERFHRRYPINTLGTYEFLSIADLESGAATRFTRATSGAVDRVAGAAYDLYLSDHWRFKPTLSLQYGIRFDISRSGSRPRYNPEIDSIFGYRTNDIPRTVAMSPRASLQWSEKGHGWSDNSLWLTVGKYQSTISASTVAGLRRTAGFPDDRQILDCVGSATPTVNWGISVPDRCQDGSGSVLMGQDAPSVAMFSPDYRAPTQWRVSALWNNFRVTRFVMRVEYSIGLAQPDVVDVNMRRTPRFFIANEANRPVFVADSAIVPSSGAATTATSRRASAYGPVLVTQSDGRSSATSLSIWKSMRVFGPIGASVSYRFQTMRRKTRSYGAVPTQGDPSTVMWSHLSSPRHQLGVSMSWFFSPKYWMRVDGWLTSGSFYTPMVSGDINGDGRHNDIAYIFDHNTAPTPELRQGMTRLLSQASRQARSCLQRQTGRIAGHNSCHGPWSSRWNMTVGLDPSWMPHSSGILLSFSNVGGAIDRLLHGPNRRGWGTPPVIDQTLLYVSGFDRTTQSFRYTVNPRFGQHRANTIYQAPFQVRLTVSTPIGPSLKTQQERALGRRVLSSNEPLLAALKRNTPTPDWLSEIRMRDTLRLMPEQLEQLAAIERQWRVEVDSLYMVYRDRIDLVDGSDQRVGSLTKQLAAEAHAVALQWGRKVLPILTDRQFELLPRYVQRWLDGKTPESSMDIGIF